MIKELVKLANHLDGKGLVKEADYLDRIIKKAEPFSSWSKGNAPGRTSLDPALDNRLTEILTEYIESLGITVISNTTSKLDLTGELAYGGDDARFEKSIQIIYPNDEAEVAQDVLSRAMGQPGPDAATKAKVTALFEEYMDEFDGESTITGLSSLSTDGTHQQTPDGKNRFVQINFTGVMNPYDSAEISTQQHMSQYDKE